MVDSKKDILWRVFLVYFGMLLFGIAIIAKMVYIQVKEGPELMAKAQKQEIRIFNLKADRGNILSAKGNLLATSVPVFEIRMDVANNYISNELFNKELIPLSQQLSLLFKDKSSLGYKRMLAKARAQGNRYLLLQRKVSYEQLKALRKFPILKNGRNRGGLIAIQKTKRQHPFGNLAARTIGYEIPKEGLFVGIEGAYSKVLTGTDGKQIKRRINHGAWIPVHDDNEVQPNDGMDVVTTLDVNLQDVAEEALMKQMQKHEAMMGCAVLMQVKSGDIKAMANLRFNSKTGSYDESYNMAIGEKFEPGSTFKLASILAALEDHKIKLTDTLNIGTKGVAVYYKRTLHDVHPIGNGIITIREAFEHSSNVGISKMIFKNYKNNPAQFIKRLYALGLNKKLGIELSGEAQPYIKNPSDKKHWYLTSLPWMSVGYELELTPLQILSLYNAVANNGCKVKPRFVSEITDGGRLVKKIDTTVLIPQIASPEIIKKVQSLLEGVVLRGTAQNLKNDHFEIAGKTGTAKISENGHYIHAYNATFVGYFPADNPQYSCIVVINKPKHGYYGSGVAAPVFKEIADKVYATSLSLTQSGTSEPSANIFPVATHAAWYPDLKTIYQGLNVKQIDYLKGEQWASTMEKSNTIVYKVKDFNSATLPDVRGMRAKDAIFLLENRGLIAEVKGRGFVRSQSLKPGSKYKKGQKILIRLSLY